MLFQMAVFLFVGRIAAKLHVLLASLESALFAAAAPSTADKGKRERHATPHTQSNNYYHLLAAPIG
jgi:hypothetical protein